MSADHSLLAPARRRWLLPLLVGLAAVGAGALTWSGAAQTLASVASIGAITFVVGTVLATAAYGARFVRWQLMLQRLGHRLPVGFSARVYLAGLALSATPAKLGETLRSALLLLRGVPVADSLAAFFADRLADVIGVAALGAAAGWLAGARQPVLEAIAVVAFLLAALAAWWLRGRHRAPLIATLLRGRPPPPWLAALGAPALAWSRLWSAPRAVLFATAAVVAFGTQAIVFYAYVHAVAPQPGVWPCVAIFASATLIGAASMIPAGLGAMEVALTWQLTTQGLDWPQALAVVLATRASTLWCGTALGALMLASVAGAAGRAAAGARS